MMFLLHDPPGFPSCIPSTSKSGIMKAAYQGNTDTLQENVKDSSTKFCWCFTHKEKQENIPCKSDCLNSSVVLACLVVSDLRESGNQLTVSEDVELLNTTKHLLVLNLTKDDHNCENYRNLSSKEKDCNHGNITYDPNVSQHLVCCHVGTLHLLHTSNLSSCHLHLHLHVLVEGPVGELVLNIPTRNQNHLVLFSVTAASNMTVCLLANAAPLYRNCSYATAAEVVLLFNHTGTVVIELQTENRVPSQNRSVRVCVEGNRKASPQDRVNSTCQPTPSPSPVQSRDGKAVRILAAKQAYPTNTDVTFLAVADVPDPVDFLWLFGDFRSARTTSRTVTKRYQQPGSYDVVVVASHGQTSVTSDAFPLVVQRAVKLNRLVHQASVPQNQTVSVSCRVNVGTNLTFLWNFGDGTTRPGQNTEQHVFHKLGEFRLEVTVSNMVSSASLSSYIFVVDRPCRPPPVKNMGPPKLQVRRYEVIRLGVTYETKVDCDVSEGLNYTWTLFDSAGRTFSLPLTDTHRQSLTLQRNLLPYDTYTAVARVQVIGTVVYSNYSVRVQVMPSPPVVFIQGGTNVFINRSSGTIILDGQASYDPDFPVNPLSYSWTCKPVSSIASSCFDQHVHTSSPVLQFPAGFLKHNFDQFQFTLTVHSGERSASSETFVTITPNLSRRMSVSCPECQGDHVSWDQTFSVTAMCEDCDIPAELIQYSWSLYVVNASSKPVTEVPFCSTVDLTAFSSIMENAATSPQTPEISTPHPPAASSHSGLSESEPSSSQPVLTYSDHTDQEDIISESPVDPDSSTYWDVAFPVLESGGEGVRQDPDYDVPFPSAEEGDPGMSAGRPTGVDGESFSPGDDSVFDPATRHQDEGSNLVDPKPSLVIQEPSLLDLPRHPVDRGLFQSYTYTGSSSPSLIFRPFSLKPGSRYMLEVAAKHQNSILGRTQLFLQTKPVPKGMTCQVQPAKGTELHTHFSIFCTSGREDLLYEYSYRAGGRRRRMLYQGRDFQLYFSLPSGDPSDDYKVTIYTEIRSGTSGSATKPCPVTVQVQPSFLRHTSSSSSGHDPDLELSESGLRNLSALMQLGNSAEICSYVSLLSTILNRLSLDAEANTQVQRHMRNVLIGTVCELEQVSVTDSICILEDLLQVTDQVALMSARRVTAHVRGVSEQFSESSPPHYTNQKMLSSLISLLSYSLQAVINCSFTPETPNCADMQTLESHTGRKDPPNACLRDSSAGPQTRQRRSTPTEQVMQLVTDILQTASDLMLKSILFHETKELSVSSGLITLYAASQNQTSAVISSGSTTFHMPESLIQILFNHHGRVTDRFQRQPCVLIVLTELSHSPFTWASSPAQLSGPVVDLSLYKCSTKRKIPVRSLIQPIVTELHHLQRNRSSVSECILLHSQVNYHSFNITQEHLQQAIQLTVAFTPPSTKAFPIMLLFRMFERPTPSMHHLQRVHRWESNTTRITLPPSYLSAAGVGHLALLNADFGKAPRSKHLSEQLSYSLMVDSSLCLSWDSQQGAWTSHGCRTEQADTSPAVKCSCRQLKPLTVMQQQIQSNHETADLDPFLSLSASGDLTVLAVLMLCLCLYIPGLVACQRADVVSEDNRRIHHLSDNPPSDPHLYAVTVHTGLWSAARMSAKVYIVLYGEDGTSQTRELQVPECTLFRRNSQDTFILSSAEGLGPLWGVHIWHDNSGASPEWYLKQVEVSEVSRGCVRRWLFVGQCWLAVNKGDGRVERELRVCTEGIGFVKMLHLKLSEYMADFHIWMSVYSCSCPNSFTHTQRLTVCLLLLLGYACVNAVIISQMDDQLLFIDMSAVSVTTGLLSAVAVLPGATVVSLLFRRREVKLKGSGVQQAKSKMTEKDCFEVNEFESHLSWSSCQQWDSYRKKYQDADLESLFTTCPENKDTDKEPDVGKEFELLTEGSRFNRTQKACLNGTRQEDEEEVQQEKDTRERCSSDWSFEEGSHIQTARPGQQREKRSRPTSQWCHCLAWTLCLLLSLSCLVLSAVLGMRFSSSKALLWIHSFFFSLTSCIFLVQPAVILTAAVTVSCWYRKRSDFYSFSSLEALKMSRHTYQPEEQITSSTFPQRRRSYLEKLLGARQRARFLRVVRPPTPAELRKNRRKKRRDALMHKTLRDLSLCVFMLLLMMCITYSSSFSDHYHLNRAVRRHFMGNHGNAFMSVQMHEDWWKWTQTSLLDLLYKSASSKTESYIVIGDPILQKMEVSDTFQIQISMVTLPRLCGPLGCYSGLNATVGSGHTKSDAASKLELLRSGGWPGGQTMALKVQFTLYSPATNLFTSVALLTEQSPTRVLLPSVKVQSVRVYHTAALWDYVITVCQLFFFVMSLLQLCLQVSNISQQGLMGYLRKLCNLVEVSLLMATIVYYVCHIYHSVVVMEVVELLQRRSYRGHVDVGLLATWEQCIRTLRGIMVFLLTVKCATVLRLNRTLTVSAALFSHSLSSLLWPAISGLILLVALSCVGHLLDPQNSWSFGSVLSTVWTLLCRHRGLGVDRHLLFSGRDLFYYGVLCLTSTLVWAAMVIAVVSSLARAIKRCQNRRNVFTMAELASYIRQRVSEFTGRQRRASTSNHEEGRMYYLEEFESSVDELLFRLNALSSSLHHTLPPKAHRYREEDSPVSSSISEPQRAVLSQMMVKDAAGIGDHSVSNLGETPTSPHLVSSQVKLNILQVLQQRSKMRHNPSSDYKLKGDCCLSCPEPPSLKGLWKGDVLEKQADQQSKTNDWLRETQPAHREVVVEVLVHDDPGKVEPDIH
ncbi:polycystic kidney disease 1 like 1 [Acanthochromis polyacanthus]|uniref:polycystic kidney disease 1 like 1 n=1 Tax=Acanthochromis polyacanthus TaxID=80966 RepID=UPI0022346388|nr:polycystic kidney disease 1 like 1 [Acanthochromis polyacanthus]